MSPLGPLDADGSGVGLLLRGLKAWLRTFHPSSGAAKPRALAKPKAKGPRPCVWCPSCHHPVYARQQCPEDASCIYCPRCCPGHRRKDKEQDPDKDPATEGLERGW